MNRGVVEFVRCVYIIMGAASKVKVSPKATT